ncbi:murein hydrolase activator EnvC family protein [Atopococcus tabaci]|uniref:murein hydrolase activator EnvC family protein n=1 Tax=Atopococcus tabaci TaxID=269774 RepID=UPI002409298C|nr:peptidoglycan DD-metalloendopeptidase family protein [Atopococcus tabaci]
MNKRWTVRLIASMLFAGSFIMPVETAEASRLDELQQEKNQLQDRSSEVQKEIQYREKNMRSLAEEKAQLENEVADLQRKIDDLVRKLQEQQEKLDETIAEIERLKKEIEELKEQIERREEKLANQARAVQTQGDPNNMLDIIVSAESLSDLIGRVGLVNQIVTANKNIVIEQENDKKALEETEAQVQAEKEQIEKIKAEMEVDRNNLVASKAELDDKIIQVAEMYQMNEEEKKSFVQEQQVIAQKTSTLDKEMQKEQQRIIEEERKRQAAIQKAAEEKARKQAEVQAAAQSKSSSASQTSSSSSSSGFIRPANGYKTSNYGYRTHPIYGYKKLHAGLDISGGGPIVAAQSGTVVQATYNGGWGYYVKIDHGNGLQTLYAHMQAGSLRVAPGQKVSQGQQLGIMGTTGASTGVHLHFEVYKNGRTVDPAPYLGM